MQKIIKKLKYLFFRSLYVATFLYRQMVHNFQVPRMPEGKKTVLLCNLTSSPPFPGFNQLVLWLMGIRYMFKGYKVFYLYCNSAMSLCPQGSSFRNPHKKPPCLRCRTTRSFLFSPFIKVPIIGPDQSGQASTQALLGNIEFIHTLRHFFKRFHLNGVANVDLVERKFQESATSVLAGLSRIHQSIEFDEVLLFNGVFFPEQSARKFFLEKGIKVLSYEVGFTKLSYYITEGLAPEYDFSYVKRPLTAEEDLYLDKHLQTRFAGNFEMGFTKFWKKLEGLGELESKFKQYRQVVTLFTNSVYDTSTVFSNLAYEDLFQWLEHTLEEFRKNPDVLIVIRSHPDEFKDVIWEKNRVQKTQETIKEWLTEKGFLDLPNLILVEPTHYLSSYALIQNSDFLIVYNSTVGLEGMLMGKKVLCGGKPKYYQLSFLDSHKTPESYMKRLRELLVDSSGGLRPQDVEEARSFFYQLFFLTADSAQDYLDAFEFLPSGSVMLKKELNFK